MSTPVVTQRALARPKFYVAMAIAAAVIVFIGFSPTYYLRSLFELPSLPALVHVHGALCTAWIALFVAQAWLVRSARVAVHRWLGTGGAVLALLVVCVGVPVAIDAAIAGKTSPGVPPLDFLARQFLAFAQFGAFVALGIAFRRRAQIHKRLMLLATISVLTPALARLLLGLSVPNGVTVASFGLDAFVLAMFAYDLRTRRRLQAATLWGGLAVVFAPLVRAIIGRTDWWHSIAVWLTATIRA